MNEDVASIPDEALTFLAGQVYAAAHELLTYAGRGGLLVGAVADPDLGPVLAVGFGGGRAGLGRGLRSACCRSRTQKSTLIDLGDGVAAQLDGFRGSPLLDREALRELMLRFALLLREVPEVVVADLNPVRCMTSGCVVLDMRLRVERPARWSASRPGDEPWPGPTGARPARRTSRPALPRTGHPPPTAAGGESP